MIPWKRIATGPVEAPGGRLRVGAKRNGHRRSFGRLGVLVRFAAVLGIFTWSVHRTVSAADVFKMPAGLRSLEMVIVDHPGNIPDTNGFGAVGYAFRIGKFEVSSAQYVEFLSAKAKADGDGALWNNDMDKARSGAGPRCEIRRSDDRGSYHHTVAPDFANRPVNFVSFLDACRFCNWLHNGQGDADTETGAYTLNGYQGTDGRRIRRNPGARYFVPTEDEWYKAAYFDPGKSGGPGYWRYPTRSDAKPGRDSASPNAANYYAEGNLVTNYYLIASDNSGTFSDVTLRLRGAAFKDKQPRAASVLNEGWERALTYDEKRDEWVIAPHTMVFGDVNVWVIPKG